MRLLLDTHILIWLMEDNPRLSVRARDELAGAREILVSSASLWEIAIKVRVGKLNVDMERLIARMDLAGAVELTVTHAHALATMRLPMLHRDPFDRLLVAQAQAETMRLLTADPRLTAYSELVIAV
ncbi:MAG TPA: type II toxin-antitoxin system VapC family toxin [Terracidiphilus sp.]|jgi:PIN domain nuclease of toxin-antitoxin system|nr:type II toxin-antitoxin system VapC family toxin [Terracidiphilus sp.]